MSWRTLKRLPRTCRWLDILKVRQELTLYHSTTSCAKPGLGRPRVFSWSLSVTNCRDRNPSPLFVPDTGAGWTSR